MFARTIKTGQLIVAIAAAVSNPTSVFVGRAALSALSLLSDELSNRHPTLTKLATEIDRAFHRELAKPIYDKPADARLLLPQMLEASADRMEFAAHGLDAGRILDDLIDRLDAPDYQPEHLRAFRRLMAPILEQVCNDPRLKAALDPALTRIQMQRQQEQSTQIEIMLERLGGIEQALETPESLSLPDLTALANRFGAPDGADPAGLVEFLSDKADEYSLYRDQIDRLDDRVSAVADLKSQALTAAQQLDFDAVENILSQVTRTEATLFAETTEARAGNALLRGRPDQAFTLLSAAADAFGAVEPAQPPQQRNLYAARLLNHALRYGGSGFARAADMLSMAEHQARATGQEALLATCQQNRGIALHNLARHSTGADGAALLNDAIGLLDASLAAFDPATTPTEYATAQQNLGAALSTSGNRTAGPEGILLLNRSADAFEQAIAHTDRATDPRDWARLQQNLAVALKALAERQTGDDSAAAIIRSVAAFETALAATPQTDQPDDWATIQLNLGSALTTQAETQTGPLQSASLTRAIAALEGALVVYTHADHPLDWLLVQNNLGNALAFQAALTKSNADFTAAEAAYLHMLGRCDQDAQPLLWAIAHENLAALHLDWADVTPDGSDNHLGTAQSHIENALLIYDPTHFSQDHETASALRDQITARLTQT